MKQFRGRPKSGPQKYFVPVLKMEIKVEILNNKKYVADFPDGAERISYYDMTRMGWVHMGPWIQPVDASSCGGVYATN